VLKIYLEGGAGPIYLGLKTHEQEKPGFSFLDQLGLGIELHPTQKLGIILGYRLTHMSHAGLLRTKNRGIESNTILLGLRFRY